jgi:hypothetical protein
MDYAKIAQQLIKAGAKYAKAELAKDSANLYSLKAEWWLPAIRGGLPKGEYSDDILNIFSDGETTLVWYNPFESTPGKPVCDGASRFPDTFLGVNLVPGSVSHDGIYRKLKEIARAFGVPESVVRKFADKVFASVNLAENAGKPCVKTVSTMTYWGVRLFGGIYHRRHIATATAVAALLLSGCAGCVSTIFEDPAEYRSPAYEKVADTNAPSTIQPFSPSTEGEATP